MPCSRAMNLLLLLLLTLMLLTLMLLSLLGMEAKGSPRNLA